MANLTKFGSVGIAKKMFGNKEVLKEVFNGSVIYEKVTTEPFLTFSSPNSFTLKTSFTSKGWDNSLYYSTNKTTWTEWNGTTTLSSASDGTKHNLYLRGTNNTYMTDDGLSWWVLTGSNISCSGNIENLLDYSKVINGEHPTMAMGCYSMMFSECPGLVSAPELPATTLVTRCYEGMFFNCTSLTTVPELPATTLAQNCYTQMFMSCTSLTSAPILAATELARYCYYQMFYGCTALTVLPALPATTLANFCYRDMFNGCTGIKLSDTQTGEYQTPYRIPTSGTGTTASNALTNMFTNTGGTFTGTPSINTTYYTSNTVI